MPEYKYLTDKRKVVIIGALNSTEYIVQEVFVTDTGVEIPSGENFTAKNLLDVPAVSWKEKALKDLEDRYEKEKKLHEKEIQGLRIQQSDVSRKLKTFLDYQRKVLKNLESSGTLLGIFNTMQDFLIGNINFLVTANLEIVSFIGEVNKKDRYDTWIRLLSLFGKDDGTISWRVNQYNDGSGSETTVYPFKDKESALKFVSIKLNKLEKYTSTQIDLAIKYDLKLNPKVLKEYTDHNIKQIEINSNNADERHTKNMYDHLEKIVALQNIAEKFKI